MIDSSDQVPIDVLADEFVTRLRNGEAVDVEQYAARWPDLADEIRSLFPTVEAMERLKKRKNQELGNTAGRPQQIGDFRVLREIGRGGMGIVYEAVQESLDRHVALKVLPRPSVWDERRLRRFQREARMAARLHHTNIVPVLGVGEEDGHHYIVMQFIRGVGLDEVIAALARLIKGDNEGASQVPRSSRADTLAHSLANGRPSNAPTVTAFGETQPMHALPQPGLSGTTVVDDEEADLPRASASDSGETRTAPLGLLGEGPPTASRLAFGIVSGDTTHVASDDDGSGGDGSGGDGSGGDGSGGDGSGGDVRRDSLLSPAAVLDRNSDVISRRSPLWRNIARVGAQAAEALHYAHQQGTTHRDVKPGNLLLDEQGKVWVADFGLAIEQEGSHSDDVVGTLRYMAPEQLRGQTDARSDVYSLGLSLYELLTLQPAFDDRERRRFLLEGRTDYHAPSLRRFRDVPRDLETVVLKAIEPEPRRRYQSAQELAEDLMAFVEHRPIQARRVSPVERLFQWCRRNKALAASLMLAASLLVAITVTASIAYWRTRGFAIAAQSALTRETTQRRRAEATLDISLEALDRVYRRFAPDRMRDATSLAVPDAENWEPPPPPPITPADAAMLEDILQVYDRFAEQGGDSPRLMEEAAQAHWRVAEIQRRLGNFDRAAAACQRAIEQYQRLGEKADNSVHDYPRLELARIYNELGMVRVSQRQRSLARQAHTQALEQLQAARAISKSLDMAEIVELAKSRFLLALTLPSRDPDQRSHLLQAIEQLESVADREVELGRGEARHLLARCYMLLENDPFGPLTEVAIGLLEQLVGDFPQQPDYRFDMIVACARGDVRSVFQRKRLETRLRRALEHSRHLVGEYPNVRDYVQTHAHVLQRLGSLLSEKAETELDDKRLSIMSEAESLLQLAVDHQTILADRFPQEPAFRFYLTHIQNMLAIQLVQAGKYSEAKEVCHHAIDQVYGLPATVFNHGVLATAHAILARAHEGLGEAGDAADARANADYHREQLQRGRLKKTPPPSPPLGEVGRPPSS